jgi:autotransporter-associated beta strand protein
MSRLWLLRVLRWRPSWARSRRKLHQVAPTFRPQVRQLEDRLAPSVFTWTGLGKNGDWSLKQNWTTDVGGKAVQMAPPANGKDTELVFPNQNKRLTNTDDIPKLALTSIVFRGVGYTLDGENTIDFVGTKAGHRGISIPFSTGPGTDTVKVKQIDAKEREFVFSATEGTTLNVASTITGNSTFFKDGLGTLVLSGEGGNRYSGETRLVAGTLSIDKGNALGSSTFVTLNDVTVQAAGRNRVVENAMRLGGHVTFAGSQRLNFTGAVALVAQTFPGEPTIEPTLIVTNAPGTYFTGVIKRGEERGASSLTKKGAGRLVLAGADTYGGKTVLEDGELVVGNDKALGASELVIKAGTLASPFDNKDLAKPGQAFTLANPVRLEGDARIGGKHPLALTGDVRLAKDVTLTVTNSATTAFGKGIRGTGTDGQAFTKAGDGVLILGGKSTYTGATTVDRGLLEVNGALAADSKVNVKPAGTLSGTGAVGVVSDEGTLKPGPAMGQGTLHIDRLAFSGRRSKYAAVLRPEAAGSGHGEGVVNAGAVDLSKTELVLDRGAKFTARVGDRVRLLRAPGGIQGAFSNQPAGSHVTFNDQVFAVLYEKTAVVLKRTK